MGFNYACTQNKILKIDFMYSKQSCEMRTHAVDNVSQINVIRMQGVDTI
jgi:hypothetical protein